MAFAPYTNDRRVIGEDPAVLGQFREFAWENYDDVMNLYYTEGQNYVNRFAHALERGEIKKYEEAA